MTDAAIEQGHEQAICEGKQPYANFTLAKMAMRRASNNNRGSRVEPYKCRFCGQFHVGSSQQHKKKKVRK